MRLVPKFLTFNKTKQKVDINEELLLNFIKFLNDITKELNQTIKHPTSLHIINAFHDIHTLHCNLNNEDIYKNITERFHNHQFMTLKKILKENYEKIQTKIQKEFDPQNQKEIIKMFIKINEKINLTIQSEEQTLLTLNQYKKAA